MGNCAKLLELVSLLEIGMMHIKALPSKLSKGKTTSPNIVLKSRTNNAITDGGVAPPEILLTLVMMSSNLATNFFYTS